MTYLILLAAFVALSTHPDDRVEYDADRRMVVTPPSAGAYVAWAAVSIVMVAGLVAWAVWR